MPHRQEWCADVDSVSVLTADDLSFLFMTVGRRVLVAQLEWPMWEQCAPRATQEALMW